MEFQNCFDIHIIDTNFYNGSYLEKIIMEKDIKIHVHLVNIPNISYKLRLLLYMLKATLKGLKIQRQYKFDVIYSGEPIVIAVPAFLVGFISKTPVIYMVYLEQILHDKSDSLYQKVKFKIVFNIIKSASAILVINKTQKQQLISLGINKNKIHIVKIGIDTERFYPYETNKEYEGIFIGNLSDHKGIDTLIDAWKELVKHNSVARLIVVGGGNIEKYKKMVANKNLQKNIVFTGFIENDKIPDFLNKAKIFIFPSRAEAFGVVIGEAMASGLPCVISDIPVLREIWGEVAILAKPNDAIDFANAILKLLTNEDLRQEYSMKCRKYIENFSWDRIAKKEMEIIKQSIEK